MNTVSACHFCTREIGIAAVRATGDADACLINGPHWTGTAYVRVDMCGYCHKSGRGAKRPRKPRRTTKGADRA